MSELLAQIANCVERGKVDAKSPYPPDLKGQPGADELTAQALAEGVAPDEVLSQGLIIGMHNIGQKFSENKVFIPDMLMAAKAMKAAMAHIRPYFESGQAHHRGTFVVGTVQGDLHDIGKNIVAMVMEGGGWKVIDLGVDVSPEKFLETAQANPGCAVGLSALLTTTMVNMEKVIKLLRENGLEVPVVVGGAPLTEEFARKIGANRYSPDPQGALEYLEKACA